ncbi:MAG: nickel-dependent lactate racemase [Clostridiales bacterium]|nr:nickel-dependent lactate racemase [Clostridiales bacterium]
MKIKFPYGKEHMSLEIPESRINGILRSGLDEYKAKESQEMLIEDALKNPIGSKPLCQLAEGKKHVILIASDHTRPVPSRLIVPPMLREIRKGNPHAEITILVATGCHRETMKTELNNKFGKDIVEHEKIIVHDCDKAEMTRLGVLPGGGECILNRMVVDADLVVSEGFIEPHFFAGFSGGRKSILPGIADRRTVLANHCSEFIADPHSRTGIMKGNPIHEDMMWAARKAGLAFIVNVVLNEKKEVVFAIAGDVEQAHEKGCDFLNSLCRVKSKMADIVISTNGGYPLDQNIYQAVKGMTAAEATVKKGGVIIMLAKSEDGHGGENFYHQLADEPDINQTLNLFLSRKREETEPDQWQSQILIRILQKARVIYISDAPDEIVRAFHMIPAHSLEEAMCLAEFMTGIKNASVTVIPDGVSTIVI